MRPPILEVSGLTVAYSQGLSECRSITAVRNVSFTVRQGQTLGLIGESGSGKSTALNAVAGLVKKESGKIIFDGKDVSRLSRKERHFFRRETAMLFQSAAADPKMKIYNIVAEPLRNYERLGLKDERLRVAELLELVNLSPMLTERYPRELSGGQLQRVGIARALALRPSLLLADEPVTALDATMRKQVLDMLRKICDEFKIACVFVTHDLGVARHMCDSFCIMRQGEIVERGEKDMIFQSPKSLYTKLLIASALPFGLERREQERERRVLLRSRITREELLSCAT